MTVTRGTFRGAIETSNFYLCDYCKHWRKWRPNFTGLEGRCTITEKSGSLFCKKVMHDGIERPTDVCEHYKPRRDD